ncbi:unnamed protein product [Victoria cruziana]
MAGYPPGGGYGYGYPGHPPQPYGYSPTAPPYQIDGAPPVGKPGKPSKDSTGSSGGFPGAPSAGAPYQAGYQLGYPPPPGPPYGSPFAALMPSAFPPGTDPNVVACFQAADQDGSGFIDDKELQRALSSYNQTFSLCTAIFERFDRDRSGKIDANELRDALLSLGFSVSPVVLELLISKYDPTGKTRAINYDNFIECSLVVKGLTEKFKEKDTSYAGNATFSYESFMLTVLPFLIA